VLAEPAQSDKIKREVIMVCWELWKDIPGYEGYFQASTHGNIRGLDRYVTKSSGGTMHVKGKLLTGAINSTTGYRNVGLRKDGILKRIDIHRLVALTFFGPPEDRQVNHINCNKLDNCITNLEYCSPKQNIGHAILNNRFNTISGMLLSPEGNIVEFDSVHRFSIENGLDTSVICKVLKGSRKSHKGWKLP
jgi:hypothetical protein